MISGAKYLILRAKGISEFRVAAQIQPGIEAVAPKIRRLFPLPFQAATERMEEDCRAGFPHGIQDTTAQ